MTAPRATGWTDTTGDPFLHRHDNTAAAPHGAAGPVSTGGWAQAAPDEDAAARRAAEIRRQAITRMEALSTDHAQAAWERRRRDPIEPYGIALLYRQPDQRLIAHGCRLTAATRLWLKEDHAWDVHQLVYQFHRDLAAAIPVGGTDVRTFTDRRDSAMVPEAEFFGIGVSSLDTSTGRWAEVVATAQVRTTDTRPSRLWGNTGVLGRPSTPPPSRTARVTDHRDIPGAIRIVLADSTTIVGERRGAPDFDHKILHSTHTLDYGPGQSPYPWGLVSREQLDADPEHFEVLRWMDALLMLCWQADGAYRDRVARGGRP